MLVDRGPQFLPAFDVRPLHGPELKGSRSERKQETSDLSHRILLYGMKLWLQSCWPFRSLCRKELWSEHAVLEQLKKRQSSTSQATNGGVGPVGEGARLARRRAFAKFTSVFFTTSWAPKPQRPKAPIPKLTRTSHFSHFGA